MSIRGGNICIEALDRQRIVCYGIMALRRLVTVADEALLSLSWGENDSPVDPVDELDAWLQGEFPTGRPTVVPCGSAARMSQVRAYLQEILNAYDGREL